MAVGGIGVDDIGGGENVGGMNGENGVGELLNGGWSG